MAGFTSSIYEKSIVEKYKIIKN